MSRKQIFYRQVLLLARYRTRLMSELPQPPPPKHEPTPKRHPNRPHTTIPQPIKPHPGSDPAPPHAAPEPGQAPVTMRERVIGELRQHRGSVVTRYDVKRVRRLIPLRSTSFELRYRNLSYKRKWNVVWS